MTTLEKLLSMATWGTKEIQAYMGAPRLAHITNTVTKEPGFPEPIINRSQKEKRWDVAAVVAHLAKRNTRKKREAVEA